MKLKTLILCMKFLLMFFPALKNVSIRTLQLKQIVHQQVSIYINNEHFKSSQKLLKIKDDKKFKHLPSVPQKRFWLLNDPCDPYIFPRCTDQKIYQRAFGRHQESLQSLLEKMQVMSTWVYIVQCPHLALRYQFKSNFQCCFFHS